MNAIDMNQFVAAKSDQLNAEDFLGGPRTFRIAGVAASGSPDQPVNVRLEGEERFFRPCKSMRRVMIAVWGADSAAYIGQAMTLYRDPKVTFGGMQTGGIRISHMSGISNEQTVVIMEKKGKKAGISIKPLAAPSATRSPAAPPPAAHSEPANSAGDAGAAQTVELPAAVQEWVDGVIGEIRACQSITDLAELQAARKVETKLARYPKQRDDLVALFNDRRAVIEGGAE